MNQNQSIKRVIVTIKNPSSFRDNSGFVFSKGNVVYRQVNASYKENYEHFIRSGLYEKLVEKRLLISHEEEVNTLLETEGDVYKILRPEPLFFISYPYGWSFHMLKDAALLTLKIQEIALAYGMVLKDASAYNIQFVGSCPIFIDTLSFEIYQSGTPWIAYGQFCRHFLAPLALMSYRDMSLNKLLIAFLDGIPLDMATRLLPFKSRFNLGLYLHLFLQAKTHQRQLSGSVKTPTKKKLSFSEKTIQNLTTHLASTVENLTVKDTLTTWDNYYEKWVGDEYMRNKQAAVRRMLEKIRPISVLDLGANDGLFSNIAAESAEHVYSFDIDPRCVDRNYLNLKNKHSLIVTPLVVDLTNPEPAIGWANTERAALWERINGDTILALALIHHLHIANNIPLDFIAALFAKKAQYLIVEFVPKSDDKVQQLLAFREDIFPDYTYTRFKEIVGRYFQLQEEVLLHPTERQLVLFSRKHEFNSKN